MAATVTGRKRSADEANKRPVLSEGADAQNKLVAELCATTRSLIADSKARCAASRKLIEKLKDK